MIFVINLLVLLYLYFQRYFNNGILSSAFPPSNFADYFYLSEMLLFTLSFVFSKNKKAKLPSTLAITNIFFIAFAEASRRVTFFSEKYFLGYPLSKSVVAASYSAVFLISLFLTLYFVIRPFTGKFSAVRTIFSETLVIAVLLAAGIYFNLTYSDDGQIYSGEKTFDYAVVLGAAVKGDKPFPVLKARIEKARELYEKKIVRKILLTGGAAPGEKSEARVSFDYLLRAGVPEKDLIPEEKTTSTFEQIKFLRKLSEGKSVTFIVVSDAFHLRRVQAMAKFLRVPVATVSSGAALRFEKKVYFRIRDSLALLLFLFFAI
jgi:vancomycin permeability regulator SanA